MDPHETFELLQVKALTAMVDTSLVKDVPAQGCVHMYRGSAGTTTLTMVARVPSALVTYYMVNGELIVGVPRMPDERGGIHP